MGGSPWCADCNNNGIPDGCDDELIRRNASFAKYTVDGDFNGAASVFAADVDGDGDTDVGGAAFDANDIAWGENTAGDGTAWTEHIVDGSFNGAVSVFAAYVDGDVDLDADDCTTFIGCLTGPEGGILVDCDGANFDDDNDVDLGDSCLFQDLYAAAQ